MARAYMTFKLLKTDSTPIKVLPHLFIGSIGAAYHEENLTSAGITHVLCVAQGIKPRFKDRFDYMTVPLLDSPTCSLLPHLEECHAFIERGRAAGGVLVHCFAGKSRSASVIVAYLMKSERWRLIRALAFLRDKRPVIQPNIGFLRQLRQLDHRWFSVHSSESIIRNVTD
eukprot:TRINITY_DN67324_c9_g2_i1.p3 TRINITY_DN67324_c9_g2~~TRINITY_DN67324_c9_g2_i1.p3  ORF type:complete len:170 (-),score=60.78 TRINITY_DN67324_c9_g2_i1:46-555(-)